MKRRFQKVQTYTFDTDRHTPGLKGTEHTERTSFSTLEKAIESAKYLFGFIKKKVGLIQQLNILK